MRRTPIHALLLALLLASPLAAYTIHFRDGRTIQTKGPYKIVNGRAVVTMLNGTQASIDPKEIDERKTQESNKRDYGAAEILDPGTAPRQGGPQAPSQERLSDLINSRRAASKPSLPDPRSPKEGSASKGRAASKTLAGFPDFARLPRQPHSNTALAGELRQFFLGQKVAEVEVFDGSQASRPLIEITTQSESSVFRALATAANALLHVRDRHPEVTGLDLLMLTPSRERGGQFSLTPEMAEDLVAKRVSLVSFFLDHVQF